MRVGLAKAGWVGPRVFWSTILWLTVGALWPPSVAPIGLGLMVVLPVLAAGLGERLVARLLIGARPPAPVEEQVMTSSMELVSQAGLMPPGMQVLVRPGGESAPVGFGRRTLIIPVGVLYAIEDGRLPPVHAAAVIGPWMDLTRRGWFRSDPALQVWLIPWRVVAGVLGALARAASGLPFIGVAWRLRGVMLAAGVARYAYVQQPWIALGFIVIAVFAYGIPAGARHWERRLTDALDESSIAGGLAGPRASLLRRGVITPVVRERLRRLEGHAPERSEAGSCRIG